MIHAALRQPNRNENPGGSQPDSGSTSVKTYLAVCLSFCMTKMVMHTAMRMPMWKTAYVFDSRFSHLVERLLMQA